MRLFRKMRLEKRIDIALLVSAGSIGSVGALCFAYHTLAGGAYEMQFPYAISPEFLKVIGP
jgi:hypothetical protein